MHCQKYSSFPMFGQPRPRNRLQAAVTSTTPGPPQRYRHSRYHCKLSATRMSDRPPLGNGNTISARNRGRRNEHWPHDGRERAVKLSPRVSVGVRREIAVRYGRDGAPGVQGAVGGNGETRGSCDAESDQGVGARTGAKEGYCQRVDLNSV